MWAIAESGEPRRRQPYPTSKEDTMTTTTVRLTRVAAAGLLTLGLATTPASALRLIPHEPPSTTITDEPAEDTSLLLSAGRVAHHIDTAAGTTAAAADASPHVSPATVERLFTACVDGAPRSPDAYGRTVANCRESASAGGS
jgi:hypothetical protein